MESEKPKKRGGGKFSDKRSVSLTPETGAKIDKGSDRYMVTPGTIMREAIEKGIDLVLESYRKQARNTERKQKRK